MEHGEAIPLILEAIMGKAGPPAKRETPIMTLKVDSRAAGAALAEAGLQGAGNGRAI